MPTKRRTTTSGAASLRKRGLVGLPLSLTREQRDLIQAGSRHAGCASVSAFAVPILTDAARRAAEKNLAKNGKKD